MGRGANTASARDRQQEDLPIFPCPGLPADSFLNLGSPHSPPFLQVSTSVARLKADAGRLVSAGGWLALARAVG